MVKQADENAIHSIIMDYLEGMIYGDDEQLRRSMHPLCMQAGHVGGEYEFISRDAFIDAIRSAERLTKGVPFRWEVVTLDITGNIAMAKVTDDCFGSTWTDFLTFIKHDGQWRIVMKALFEHD